MALSSHNFYTVLAYELLNWSTLKTDLKPVRQIFIAIPAYKQQ